MNSTGNCCYFLLQSPTPTTHPDFSVLSPPEIIPVNTALVVPTATARLELQGQRLPVACSSLYLEHPHTGCGQHKAIESKATVEDSPSGPVV